MGIVRLAKSLKLLDSLVEYGSRKDDLANKIDGNRVYMDFVSIVYRIQEAVARELNYILFSFLLIREDLLDYSEVSILRDLTQKYELVVSEPINRIVHRLYVEVEAADLSTYKIEESEIFRELKSKLTGPYIESYKSDVKTSNNINIYIYRDVSNFIVDLLNNKIYGVEYILISFDGIPSFGKVQEQRQRRYMRFAYKEFEKSILEREKAKEKELDTIAYDSKSKNKLTKDSIKYRLFELRKIYDADYFTVDIRSAIDYVYESYHKGDLQRDVEDGVIKFREAEVEAGNMAEVVNLEIEVIDRPYGEGEKILMDRLVRDVNEYQDDKSYVFYSPDGDSVLLCLYVYIKTKPQKLTVVKGYELNPSNRHNQQSQYVDVKKLYGQIAKTINKYSKLGLTEAEDLDSLSRDYIFMLNLYGNDFIHQLPSMEISTTILDLMYIYSLFIREKTNRYITRVVEDRVHIDIDVMIRFFQYLSEYEEYLMLDSYLINTESRSRVFRTFGNIFPHRYLIRYRELVSKMKRDLNATVKADPNFSKVKQALSDFMAELGKTVTVSGRKFSDIFRKLEMREGFDKYASKISTDPDYLLRDEPRFIYKVRPRFNREEGDMVRLVRLAEDTLYRTGESIDLDAIDSSRNKALSRFSFDYSNMRDLLPHDQMPLTSNDIDLFLLEWRAGDWRTVLNSKSFELGYDSKKHEIRDVKSEMTRYQKQMLHMSDNNLEKMVGNYLRTLSWMVDYYMNADIEREQDLISTWSYNYERSPMITHVTEYLLSADRKQLKNMIKKVYDKSLIHTSRYLQKERHGFYIYPQKNDMIDRLDSKYTNVFPNMTIEVDKTVKLLEDMRVKKASGKRTKQNKVFFDCRECAYFSKCIFDAESLTFKELVSMPIPGFKDHYPIVQMGRARRTKYEENARVTKRNKYRGIKIRDRSSSGNK
jgi:XRN 5'-3' exonuclease N-terminus/Xrn1 helical domain